MPQTFGETLKERRKVQGITIVELSGKTGISQADLVRVELGGAELAPEQKQMVDRLMKRGR